MKDEILYFMEKGNKKITATSVVKDVQNFVKLIEDVVSIFEDFSKEKSFTIKPILLTCAGRKYSSTTDIKSTLD